jgi:pimeloyl-ACP methyl ester carboxylesterase
MRRVLKILAGVVSVILVVAILLLVVGPFLVPVNSLTGLAPTSEVATSDSNFVTIPFDGTDGLDIHYLADEPGDPGEPTFVLLHGSLFNVFTWNEVFDFFDARGRVVAYDQIPYGLSEKLVSGDWSGENPYNSQAQVDQLFAFLDALELENVILVGNSYGGVLAVQAALAQPERIDGLILTDPAVYVQEEMPGWVMDLPQVQRLGPLFARQLGQGDAFLRQTYLNPDQINAERAASFSIHSRVENWDTALWEYLRVWGVDAPDYTPRIPNINQPALVISGDSDAIVPVSDSERLAAELPNADLVIIPNCGHVPQEECPAAFEAAVDTWLGKK